MDKQSVECQLRNLLVTETAPILSSGAFGLRLTLLHRLLYRSRYISNSSMHYILLKEWGGISSASVHSNVQ